MAKLKRNGNMRSLLLIAALLDAERDLRAVVDLGEPDESEQKHSEVKPMKTQAVCRQPGCVQKVSAGHFMCGPHWANLPCRIQKGIMERANGWKDHGAAVEFLRSYQRQEGILKGGVL
jgi:hypothetical protein